MSLLSDALNPLLDDETVQVLAWIFAELLS